MMILNALCTGIVVGAVLILAAGLVDRKLAGRIGARQLPDFRHYCISVPVWFAVWMAAIAAIAHIDGQPFDAADTYVCLALVAGFAIAGALIFSLLIDRARHRRIEAERQNAPDAHI